MSRLPLLLALAGALAACASPTYTIQAASIADANERAQRYCGLQDRTAELRGVEKQGSADVQVYRCVPGTPTPPNALSNVL